MQAARRVYVYVISVASFTMMLAGASALVRLGLENLLSVPEEPYGQPRREQFAINAAFLVVGGIVWGIHWWLAQRSVARSSATADEERGSPLRKLTIYGLMYFALWIVFVAAQDLIAYGLAATGSSNPELFRRNLANDAGAILVYGLAWIYYWRASRVDKAATPEVGWAATVRRWYFYLAAYGMLTAFLVGLTRVIRYTWMALTSGGQFSLTSAGQYYDPYYGNYPSELAWGAGITLVAGALWLVTWLPTQRLAARSEEEQHSVLRKVYLYAMVVQTAAFALGNVAFALYSLLRLSFGTDFVGLGESVLGIIGGALLVATVYALFWAYHWQVIKWDATLIAAERPLQAMIRQFYYHVVAFIGGAVLSVGVGSMLRLLFDLGLGGADTHSLLAREWGDQICFFVTMIVVGAPVWLIHWFLAQPASGDAAALHSLPRRTYLFLVLLLSMATLLGSMAFFVYKMVLLFVQTTTPYDASQIAWALGVAATAAILFAYHLSVLLGDQRAIAQMRALAPATAPLGPVPAAPEPTTTLVLVHSSDPAVVGQAIESLKCSLPEGSYVEVMAGADLTPAELSSWLVGRRPAEAEPQAEPAPAAAPEG